MHPTPLLYNIEVDITCLQALSQALLQVRADLVDAAQKTLEGEAGKDQIETNVHQLVNQKTQELNVRSSQHILMALIFM